MIKDISSLPSIVAGDGCILKEVLSPLRDDVSLRYSLAHAEVKPGEKTALHTLKSSEVYYIIAGEGVVSIDGANSSVRGGSVVYIKPGASQCIENTGTSDLVFLCIVDPAWKKEDEVIEIIDKHP